MITIERAWDIAKKYLPTVDSYLDEDTAYIFSNSKAKGRQLVDNEVVVMKQTGSVISYVEYIMQSTEKKTITFGSKRLSIRKGNNR